MDVEAISGTTLDFSRLGRTPKREHRREVRSARREERREEGREKREGKRIKEKLEPSWMLSLSVEPPWISVDWAGRRRERIDVK